MHKKMIKDIIAKMDKEDMEHLGDGIIEAIDIVKEHEPKLYRKMENAIYVAIYGEHFNEEMAKEAVECMEFVVPEYKYSYTADQIEQSLNQIYQQAAQTMTKYGKKACIIPIEVNKWDKYYVYNMICADYPLSHGGDSTKIAMMAYEFLSDPDAGACKAYKYYCAMKEYHDKKVE